MKRKNYTIQSSATERDICDDLLYQQQHQQHLNRPRTQLLNKGRRRSVDTKSSYVLRRGDQTYGSQRSSIEVSDVLCKLLKQQSALDMDTDVFDGNPLNLKYFMTLFREVHSIRAKHSREPGLKNLINYGYSFGK